MKARDAFSNETEHEADFTIFNIFCLETQALILRSAGYMLKKKNHKTAT